MTKLSPEGGAALAFLQLVMVQDRLDLVRLAAQPHHQHRTRRNQIRDAFLSIGQMRADPHFPIASGFHPHQGLLYADDAGDVVWLCVCLGSSFSAVCC